MTNAKSPVKIKQVFFILRDSERGRTERAVGSIDDVIFLTSRWLKGQSVVHQPSYYYHYTYFFIFHYKILAKYFSKNIKVK